MDLDSELAPKGSKERARVLGDMLFDADWAAIMDLPWKGWEKELLQALRTSGNVPMPKWKAEAVASHLYDGTFVDSCAWRNMNIQLKKAGLGYRAFKCRTIGYRMFVTDPAA